MDFNKLSNRRRWRIYIVGGVLAVIGAGYLYWLPGKSIHAVSERTPTKNGNAPGIPVRIVKVEKKNLAVRLKAIGTVVPFNTVLVRSQVDGELLRVNFEEGGQINQGEVLAELNPATYQNQLNQVEGQRQQQVAQLQGAQADLERLQKLHEKSLVTRQAIDAQRSLVQELEGALIAHEARVAEAQLNLAHTRIKAPISGRLGLRRLDVGNFIRASDPNGLVVITQTRPIAVKFAVPEVDLEKVLEPYRAGEVMVVEAWDRDGRNLLATGVLRAVDNQISLDTGTVQLKAEFPNEDERLFPNQFINVHLQVRVIENAVTIPAPAVQFGSRGTYVFVVTSDERVTIRDIVLGNVDGSNQAVLSGLVSGERVVVEGFDRLREGEAVVVTPSPRAAYGG